MSCRAGFGAGLLFLRVAKNQATQNIIEFFIFPKASSNPLKIELIELFSKLLVIATIVTSASDVRYSPAKLNAPKLLRPHRGVEWNFKVARY